MLASYRRVAAGRISKSTLDTFATAARNRHYAVLKVGPFKSLRPLRLIDPRLLEPKAQEDDTFTPPHQTVIPSIENDNTSTKTQERDTSPDFDIEIDTDIDSDATWFDSDTVDATNWATALFGYRLTAHIENVVPEHHEPGNPEALIRKHPRQWTLRTQREIQNRLPAIAKRAYAKRRKMLVKRKLELKHMKKVVSLKKCFDQKMDGMNKKGRESWEVEMGEWKREEFRRWKTGRGAQYSKPGKRMEKWEESRVRVGSRLKMEVGWEEEEEDTDSEDEQDTETQVGNADSDEMWNEQEEEGDGELDYPTSVDDVRWDEWDQPVNVPDWMMEMFDVVKA